MSVGDFPVDRLGALSARLRQAETVTARLRQKADDAHGTGLHLAGYNAALDDLSILLATEVERLERVDPLTEFYGGAAYGLHGALSAIQGMRP